MRVTINEDDPRPIYVQITDEVRRALVIGSLRPGDPLPSVRRLGSDLRVNPNTVAQAYRVLEREQVVYRQRGRGTFVSPTVNPDGEQRRALARDVARRAELDAHRNGLSVEELIDTLRQGAFASDAQAGPPRLKRPDEKAS